MGPTNRFSRRTILLLDALLTGATGFLIVAGAWFLDNLLDMPFDLLWISGAILIVYVAGLVALAKRLTIATISIEIVMAINLAWGIGCVALVVTNRTDANLIGQAFVILQAVVVGAFAILQCGAIRNESPSSRRQLIAS